MKTQSISRTNLQELHNNVCDKWKKIIENKILWDTSSIISFEESVILQAYEEADETQKSLLDRFFNIPKEFYLFTIKNYSELCKLTNTKELTVKDFSQFDNPEQMLAFHQIKNIEKIYNNGWKPNFRNSSEYKYYPYFYLENASWRVVDSCYGTFFCGCVGLYKSKKISDFVGNTFMDIYLKVI